jgi:hypothetical protein
MPLKLPLDLSNFKEMRESGYLYVDKTEHAYNIITEGRKYFLSRPRRFGKSLFVSTLREILNGNKELFEGLWIYNSNYNWGQYGIIELDLSSLGIDSPESLKVGLCYALNKVAQDYSLNIDLKLNSPEILLIEVVNALRKQFGKVAVLIDEYDNPILQTLKDESRATAVRDAIRLFFTAIKSRDTLIDLVFITGVSSFTRAGLFSGFNNLRDITLNPKYATICGYTDAEVDFYLAEYIRVWSESTNIPYSDLRTQMKTWYNGYSFVNGAQTVYNPFSLMNALEAKTFKNFWFQSGTPTFLVEELKKEYRKEEAHILDPEKFEATEETLGIFDVGATPLPALMFQTGYLTIKEFIPEKRLFKLGYPNYEVRTAMQKYLLSIFTKLDYISAEHISLQLRSAFGSGNIDEAVQLIKQLFTSVPYQLHVKEEKFYHALLQVACGASGIKSQSEHSISHGRIDLVLYLSNVIYIIEIKLNDSAEVALEQIEQRRYYEAFLSYGKPITLLGLSFKREPKNFDLTYKVKYLKPKST